MNFGALAFVELASAKNAARTIARSPGRLALWSISALVFAGLLLWRAHEARSHPGALSQVISRPAALLTLGIFAAAAGANIALSAAGTLNAFRSNAEARLLSSTGLGARTIAVWLQIRAGTLLAARYGVLLCFYFLALAGHSSSGGAVLGGLLVAAAAASILAELPLPSFLLARRIGAIPVAAAGWFVAAAGALYAVAGLAEIADAPSVARPILRILRFDLAPQAVWLLSGEPAALAVAFSIPLLLAAAVVPLGKDALPDLYAVSMKTLELIANRRQGRVEAHPAAARSAAAHRTPPHFFRGAQTLLWSDWTTFHRTRFATAKWLALLLGSAGLGLFVLFAERFGVDPSEAGGIFVGLWGLALVIPVTTSISLSDEISKPIWWLAPSALRERIAMWSVAHAWRGGLVLGIGPAILGVGSGDPALALYALPAAFVAWWFLIVLGIALYAAFPSKIDTSGPAFIVRFAALGASFLPLLGVFAAVFVVLQANEFARAADFALAAAAALAIFEALLLVEFAARRIGNNAIGLALLERAV